MSRAPLQPIAAAAVLLSIAVGSGANADEVVYTIPADKLACLVEHRQDYMDLPKPLVIFSPALCPDFDGSAAQLAQNSGDNGPRIERLIMLKDDFSCLVDTIDAFLQETGETAPEDEAVAFTLECP